MPPLRTIDREWFATQLDKKRASIADLARHLGVDPSAASRIFSGGRKMKMDEAVSIARFIGASVEDVLRHAGIQVDNSLPRSFAVEAMIDEAGLMTALVEPRALPPSVSARAQAAANDDNLRLVAAQVHAVKGALSIWDDAVVVFARPDAAEPVAVGVLSIVALRDGVMMMAHVQKARKTGEATLRLPNGELKNVVIVSATPVLAVVP